MTTRVGINLVEGAGRVMPVEGVSTGATGLMGVFLKGPLNVATAVYSQADFERQFGSAGVPGTTSWDSVKAFFAKVPTGLLYIVRVASSAAAKGSKTCEDRNSSPVNTLTIRAKNEGSWGNNISVAVEDHNILATTLVATASASATSAHLTAIGGLEVGSDIKLYNGTNTEYRRIIRIDYATNFVYWTTGLTYAYTTANGVITSAEFRIKVYYSGVLVETHSGLSMNNSVSFFVETAVNSVSEYIAVTDLKTADTDYKDMPATFTVTALASGADGISDVDAADWLGTQAAKTGVYAFDNVPNLFRFCCPNPKLTDAVPTTAYLALVQSLLDYAKGRVTLEYYADIPYGTSVANAVIFAANYEGRQIAFFWPWCKTVVNGITIWLPPSSLVLGTAVDKDNRRGVHKNVGNETLAYAIDLEYGVSVTEGETLNDGGVNTIRAMTGRGLVVYGGRTRSAETKWRFLNHSEYWNFIAESLKAALQDVPFEINSETLWSRCRQRVGDFMAREQQKGALFNVDDPGAAAYLVKMDSDNNLAADVALGIATIETEFIPAGVAEKFVIKGTSSPSGFSVS